jgi:hypothetical protein
MTLRRLIIVLWPAFLMAGVLEMLVFAWVDPQELRGLDTIPPVSRAAVYTLSFLLFWGLIATAAGITAWLWNAPRDDHPPGGARPRPGPRA